MRWLPLLLIACSSPAFAQNSGRSSTGAELRGTPADLATDAGAGTLDSPISLLNAIQITAGEEGTNAAIRLGTQISDVGGRFHALSLTAGAALDKDTGTAFTSLDPFANGVFLEGKYTFTQLLGRRTPGQEALDLCRDVERTTHVAGECDTPYILANAPDRYVEFDRMFYASPSVFFAGFSGRVGRDGFSFLDPASGTKTDISRTPWSAGAFIGLANLSWHNSFTIDFRHQTRFKAAASAAVCPGTPGVTICPVGPVGPPSQRDQDVLGGEYRQVVGTHFAFSIRASYDFVSEVFQLDAPVYFVSDNSLGLNAGVRARYVHDPDPDDLNEGWVFGIFVSKSFTLFGG